MSDPDYDQCVEDHQSLLVVVKQIGPQISPKLFDRIYDGISKLSHLSIADAQGVGAERTVRVRYKKSYTIDNNDWGDFQCHRKALGLITVAYFNNNNEVESIHEMHNTLRDTFANTLYDSRCFLVNNAADTPDASTPDNQHNHNDAKGSVKDSRIESSKDSAIESLPIDIHNNDELSEETDDSTRMRTLSRSFSCAGDDIIEGFDLSERMPACGDEPIVSDSHTLTHVNIDSSESSRESPESCDENNAQNGVFSAATDETTGSVNSSPTKTLNNKVSITSTTNHTNSDSEPSVPASEPTVPVSKPQFTEYINYDNDDDCCARIENNVKDFISSIFWVLESKRLDRTHEKQDKVPLLIAPFEKKDLIGLDTDSRTFRKKCLARMRKHIADLSLLAGLPSEALNHYCAAIDQLRGVSDWLWLAGALEGQCVASLALLYPNKGRHNSNQFQRNASLPLSKISKNGRQQHKTLSYSKSLKDVKSLVNGLDPILSKTVGKNILNPSEIYDKYKESACQYAKYRNAAILEFECSFKAARVLTDLEKYLWASEFIQNAVFISFNQTNEEQIERLSRIAELYHNIGYNRKAAFYRRFAALKAVSLHLQNPNWEKCYYLLMPSLEGYGLTLDPIEYQRRIDMNCIGWPGIHMQLLQELVTTAIKMNCEPLAVRHLSFLLHSLFEYLSPQQRQEFAVKLFSLSSRCGEGSPVPLKLQNGLVIPSVNLTKFPTVVSFKVQNLTPNLRPIKLKAKHKPLSNPSAPSSPFIFTPLILNRSTVNTPPRRLSTASTSLDFKWAEGEIASITLVLDNYLPIELNISHMGLMTDGLAFETYPTSLTIPPESINTTVNLTGIPRSSGKLDILGYTTHTLGVKSDCRLRELPNTKRLRLPKSFNVEVIPYLPLIGVSSSLPKANQFSSLLANDSTHIGYSASICMYAGETKTCHITLHNNSPNSELIELINAKVISKLSKENEQSLLEWSDESISGGLPLACGSSVTFELTINGIGSFVAETGRKPSHVSNKQSTTSSRTQTPLGSHQNSPSHTSAHKKSQLLGSTTLANFISELQTSNKSKQLSDRKLSETFEPNPPKIIEAVLQFEYSGGPGLSSGYCRQSSMALMIEIQPSLLITHWDVLPADLPTNCFLVLDVMNATNQEMELHYTTNKEILIEAKETCRIPVPIERCPLIDEENDSANDSSLLSRCRTHLINQLNLNWLLPSSGVKGIASFASVPLSDEMLNSILLSPIQWEVSLNEQNLKSGNEFTFKAGQYIEINISLYNCSGNSLNDLDLNFQYYQDYQNSHKIGKERNYRLDMKKALTGFDKVVIPELESKKSYVHSCGLTFFYAGVYKLDIECNAKSTDQSVRQKTRSGERVDNKSKSPSNEWKCSQSLGITIE